jgi:hypothetical protein
MTFRKKPSFKTTFQEENSGLFSPDRREKPCEPVFGSQVLEGWRERCRLKMPDVSLLIFNT